MLWKAQISDSKGHAFKVEFDLNIITSLGTWRAIDVGVIAYSTGSVSYSDSAGTLTTKHCHLLCPDNTWGIRLNDFCDLWGMNQSGSALALQPWCLTLEPGAIEWVKFK